MKGPLTVKPAFYDGFACKAQSCRHSCCRGWEIDVDEDTAALYEAMPGPLGEELRAALSEDGGERHFRLDGEGNCPFLRRDGLCRVILSCGEDALCDICALHPRFFEELEGFELYGLGLSCEKSCELLLAEEGPLRFFVEGEARLLTMGELLQRIGRPVTDEALRFSPAFDPDAVRHMLDRLSRTEPIDEAWPRELAALRERQDELPRLRRPAPMEGYERMYHDLLYRQLERLGERSLRELCDYAALGVRFVLLQDLLLGEDAEHLRRFSEQIEYSTENVELLMND